MNTITDWDWLLYEHYFIGFLVICVLAAALYKEQFATNFN